MTVKIHAFNTNRQYTVAGQRIAYAVLSSGNVAMVDIDRGIDYVLACGNPERVNDHAVLYAYDHNVSVRTYNKTEQDEARALQHALYEAAGAVPVRTVARSIY